MKKQLLLAGVTALFSFRAIAQCLTVSCPLPVNTVVASGACNAAVTFGAPSVSSTCSGVQYDTLNYTGAVQKYVVPAGMTTVVLKAWGAQGGANWINNVNYGGYAEGTFSVTPGDTLYVYVGQQPNGITGGFNGGGNGEGAGQGGGGATDVRTGSISVNNRIIVAGGGGGAGYWSGFHVVGGVGGGLAGGDGYRDNSSNPGGQGGTQTSSGTGTCVSFNNPATAGGFGYGGVPSGCGCEGYGGGGGWWGGAGSGNCRGGGGGSGYLLPTATATSMQSGIRAGNGMLAIGFAGAATTAYTQTGGLVSGSVFPIGTTVNTFTAYDNFGDSATCSFTVTVADTTAPSFSSVPANITVSNDAGQCTAVVSWTPAVASDNCSATLSADHTSGTVFPVGTTLVTYTAVDPSGNSSSASFSVTVNDTTAPDLISPPDVTANADPGMCAASSVALGSAVAADNCAVSSTVSNAPASFPVGVTTVTWTTTDIHGNSTTGTQLVAVTDTQAPVFPACHADTTVCEGTFSFTAPLATDNCSSVSILQTSGPTSGTILNPGNYTVMFSASDSAGNTSSCGFNITVNSNPAVALSLSIPPVLCQESGTYTLNDGTPAGGTYSGNGVSGTTFDPNTAGAGMQGITYTFTDVNSCSSAASDSVMVQVCLGVNEAGQTTFQLYPNPASGSFWFAGEESGMLELTDMRGKLVHAEEIQAVRQEISLKNINAGIYMVRFTSARGISTARLVIQ
jgi:hypothetical protein